jgi:hypothetical protein
MNWFISFAYRQNQLLIKSNNVPKGKIWIIAPLSFAFEQELFQIDRGVGDELSPARMSQSA